MSARHLQTALGDILASCSERGASIGKLDINQAASENDDIGRIGYVPVEINVPGEIVFQP